MTTLMAVLATLLALGTVAYLQAPGWAWAAVLALASAGALAAGASAVWFVAVLIATLAAVALNIGAYRRTLLSNRLFQWFRKVLPAVSQTEQEALDAGTVWFDGELFSGRPRWERLQAVAPPALSAEEQAFLDGPTEALCRMVDEWRVSHELRDLPEEVWRFIRGEGFLGMIIPKRYGGLGFSALAHSEVVMRLATRSGTAAVTVMVPNSLGPAELLLHYGTEEQKNHYLPRLARGEEIPCFALTGPEAGSDAGSIPDVGVVCMGTHEGREVLGMRVTWQKRYITLGPVATLLGLAFRLRDPERLLGGEEDVGITLALVPTRHPGVNIGRRHLPMNAAFQNGPNWGTDVFIPMDWVIGGRERVGQGWRMLMESLAAGRSISLPASATGAAKLAAFATGAYARTRVQFRTPIGRFEGVEEALARIAGYTYLMDAARTLTARAVDLGEKPSVLSAVVKYHLTELSRQVVNDAMDVQGGKAICLGPRNVLGLAYQQIPIGITVEGANILTRSMIIFGQGAIRCHPWVLKEIAATRESDPLRASQAFDAALWGHAGFVASNAARSLALGLTGGRLARAPSVPETRRHYQRLTRYSSAFALAADLAMLVLGGALKRREKLSARLGDVLSHLYLGAAVLKRFEEQGRHAADRALLEWSMQYLYWRIEGALDAFLRNFPSRTLAAALRAAVFPLGRRAAPPADRLGHAVAQAIMEPSGSRERLVAGLYRPLETGEPLAQLDRAMKAAIEAEAVEAKLRATVKSGIVAAAGREEQFAAALQAGVVSAEEIELVEAAEQLRREVIAVDDFPPDFGLRAGGALDAQSEQRRRTA